MKINFRSIREKDNADLAKLIRSTFEEFNAVKPGTIYYEETTDNLFQLFQTHKAKCWVCEVEDKVIGSCGIFPTKGLPENCVELVKFYIKEQYRGQGIGKTFLQKCEVSAKKLGYKSMYLESLPEFDKAVGMYKNFGFRSLREPLGYTGHFGCDIWMLKNI